MEALHVYVASLHVYAEVLRLRVASLLLRRRFRSCAWRFCGVYVASLQMQVASLRLRYGYSPAEAGAENNSTREPSAEALGYIKSLYMQKSQAPSSLRPRQRGCRAGDPGYSAGALQMQAGRLRSSPLRAAGNASADNDAQPQYPSPSQKASA